MGNASRPDPSRLLRAMNYATSRGVIPDATQGRGASLMARLLREAENDPSARRRITLGYFYAHLNRPRPVGYDFVPVRMIAKIEETL